MPIGSLSAPPARGVCVSLTPVQRDALAEYGLVEFAGRWIYQAQPPLTADLRRAVEAKLSGPIPEGLLELWNVSFGGRLCYDLDLHFPGVEEALSMSLVELFFPGDRTYRDLPGWIEAELEDASEVAQERGEPAPTTLDYLPFGGFEYLERFYVKVTEPDCGSVWAWRRALPATWMDPLKQNGFARVSDDIRGLFARLEVRLDSEVTGLLYEHFRSSVVDALPEALREPFWTAYCLGMER